MKCSHCGADLEVGITLCPGCGTDNAEMEEELESSELPEQIADKKADDIPETEDIGEEEYIEEEEGEKKPSKSKKSKVITFTPGKLALVICSVVLLTAVLVAVIMQGMGYSFSGGGSSPTTPNNGQNSQSEIASTIPADGNPEDVTCKGSYTVSGVEAAAAMDTVVARVGNAELTNGQLQIYYWLEVQQFLANYGAYAQYYNLDYTKHLDMQGCPISETPMTWQQYFLSNALANWHTYQALAEESVENGFELDAEFMAYMDTLDDEIATEGAQKGFDSALAYLINNVGMGSSMDHYRQYTETYYRGYLYFQSVYESLVPTDEELHTYFTENEASYAANGITWDRVYVDVRHILILPEGATVSTIYSQTFPEEAWAAAEQTAKSILNTWLSGDRTEESFAALANEHSADTGSNTNGGLYQRVQLGEMVDAFEDWCFDESRKVGDYGIVKTELGYHIMYFSGSTPIWKAHATEDMLAERGAALIQSITEKYPIEVDYEAIALGYVNPEEWK